MSTVPKKIEEIVEKNIDQIIKDLNDSGYAKHLNNEVTNLIILNYINYQLTEKLYKNNIGGEK